ncbi:MAG TPA: tripartite tricarboxylate transporter substrate-binding protein [Alphaproteobacteria bacterium]|nr:tripartite tricarboxylate transporter substrate-binding protein [Alphaproteobacteria bacterium]
MRLRVCGAVALLSLVAASVAWADEVQDFYRGKSVTVVVPVAAGGNYDLAARLVGKYLVRHLPGTPSVVVQNMPGAGGISSMNFMYATAPKDGTTLAVMQRAMPQLAFVGTPNIRFDATKFTWLGTMSSYADDAFPIFIMADRPVKSWEDLRPPGKKVVLGAVASGSTNLTFPLIVRDVLKLNVDIIRGYSGAAAIYLAMQRGEVDGQTAGYGSIKATQRSLFDEHKFRFLVQFGRMTRHPELPDVPTGQELATNDADRALIQFFEAPFFMAMPFIAPPGIPEPRAAALRKAFDESMEDADFRAEAKKLDMDVSPLNGDAVAKLVRDLAAAPPEVVERFKTISESR